MNNWRKIYENNYRDIRHKLFVHGEVSNHAQTDAYSPRPMSVTIPESLSEKWRQEPVFADMFALWERNSNLATENKCRCFRLRCWTGFRRGTRPIVKSADPWVASSNPAGRVNHIKGLRR